jgi:hypothetical protein
MAALIGADLAQLIPERVRKVEVSLKSFSQDYMGEVRTWYVFASLFSASPFSLPSTNTTTTRTTTTTTTPPPYAYFNQALLRSHE